MNASEYNILIILYTLTHLIKFLTYIITIKLKPIFQCMCLTQQNVFGFANKIDCIITYNKVKSRCISA